MIQFVKPTGPCSLAKLEAFETGVGRRLPAEFRDFLLNVGGGELEENGIEFGDRDLWMEGLFSVDPADWSYDISRHMATLGPFPEEFIVIGTDPGGNSVLLDIGTDRAGSVWFWDHELEHPDLDESPLFLIDESFSRFMERLVPY